MPMWAAVVLVSALCVLFFMARNHEQLTLLHSAKAPVDIPAELRAELGEALTSLLVATRQLRTELTAFERITRRMLVSEHKERLPSGRRHSRREMDDANFLPEVRKARSEGQQWLARWESLPSSDSSRLDIEVESFAGLFEFPWALETGRERSSDRAPELVGLLEQCAAAERALARVDAALTGLGNAPYR